MEPTLPTTSSIVDYLKSSGKDSSFGARKKIYADLGFDKRLGEYTGSPTQNLNLLKTLRSSNPKPSAVDIVPPSAISVPKTGGQTTAATILQPAATVDKVQPAAPLTPSVTTPSAPVAEALSKMGLNQFTPSQPQTSAPTTETKPEAQPQAQVTPQVQEIDTQTKSKLGISASDIYPDVFGDQKDESEADLVNRWLNSSEGQIFLERQNLKGMTNEAKAEALKTELDSKYKADVQKLEENLAANGLAFSGIRGTKVKALADSLASSLLEVDRDLASKLLDANIDLREAILKGVAEIAKEADAGRKEAIQQLNAIGYAVINGELVPTLSAQREERALRAEERANAQLAMSERRLQLAEDAATRAAGGNKFTLAEVQARGLPASLVGASEQDVADSFYSPTAPSWFVEKLELQGLVKTPISPYEQKIIQDAWTEESSKYITGVTESTNAAKATKYFKSAYGEALDGEQIKSLVDRVELYINGGDSYADAVKKVIDEAS